MKKKNYLFIFVIFIFSGLLSFNFTNIDINNPNNKNNQEEATSYIAGDDVVRATDVAPTITSANIESDSLTENSVTVSYVIDAGTGADEQPHSIIQVVLLDQQGEDKDPYTDLFVGAPADQNATSGEITVNTLIPAHTYDNWYLAVLTDHGGYLWLYKDISSFNTPLESDFQNISYVTEEEAITINYELALGQDENGNPFTLEEGSKIFLYDNDNNKKGTDTDWTIDENNIVTGSFRVDNLDDSTSYYGWYLQTDIQDNAGSDVEITSDSINFNTLTSVNLVLWFSILGALLFIILMFILAIFIIKNKKTKKSNNMKKGLNNL